MSRQTRTQGQATPATASRQNEYFVPRDGIDREVISADICRYLGNDALVRPGQYDVCYCSTLPFQDGYPGPLLRQFSSSQNPQTGQTVHGYYITAYRNLTTAMIEDLKADSARWDSERRAQTTRNTSGVQYRYSETHQSRQHHGPTENPFQPDPYARDPAYENPRYPGTGNQGFTGAASSYASPPPPQQQQQSYPPSSGGPYAVNYQQNQQTSPSERFQSGQPASMMRPGYQSNQDPPYIGTGANLPHSGFAAPNDHYGSRMPTSAAAPQQPLYASAPPQQPPYPAASSPFQHPMRLSMVESRRPKRHNKATRPRANSFIGPPGADLIISAAVDAGDSTVESVSMLRLRFGSYGKVGVQAAGPARHRRDRTGIRLHQIP
ncbi:hypothetical protein XA68_16485 [Ophiocordyceps unilateralis]|uniref:Uncharacterized protein n=1 Tax=Ophiocordyceps unilateralis TaxID=268505 RepID=A0A2A9P4P5_OPHUN|nr:hypothetical protein XA68_16485 [Ophiocordyceps unilateralis]